MSKVVVLKHPLIDHKMAKIRDKSTDTKQFRETVSEIGMLVTYEITRDFETVPKQIETPIQETTCYVLKKTSGHCPYIKSRLRYG